MTAICAGDETGDEGGEGGASSAEEEQTAEDAVAAADPPRRNRQLSARAEALGGGGGRDPDAAAGPSAGEILGLQREPPPLRRWAKTKAVPWQTKNYRQRHATCFTLE